MIWVPRWLLFANNWRFPSLGSSPLSYLRERKSGLQYLSSTCQFRSSSGKIELQRVLTTCNALDDTRNSCVECFIYHNTNDNLIYIIYIYIQYNCLSKSVPMKFLKLRRRYTIIWYPNYLKLKFNERWENIKKVQISGFGKTSFSKSYALLMEKWFWDICLHLYIF